MMMIEEFLCKEDILDQGRHSTLATPKVVMRRLVVFWEDAPHRYRMFAVSKAMVLCLQLSNNESASFDCKKFVE